MEYFAILSRLDRGNRRVWRWLSTESGAISDCWRAPAALYYWTLFGAWYIVIDKTGGFSGKNYHYLEYKLFPISLDGNYMLTLALYAGFIIRCNSPCCFALMRDSRERTFPAWCCATSRF